MSEFLYRHRNTRFITPTLGNNDKGFISNLHHRNTCCLRHLRVHVYTLQTQIHTEQILLYFILVVNVPNMRIIAQ